jgi:hypothetical protein
MKPLRGGNLQRRDQPFDTKVNEVNLPDLVPFVKILESVMEKLLEPQKAMHWVWTLLLQAVLIVQFIIMPVVNALGQ